MSTAPTIQLANGRYLSLIRPRPDRFNSYVVAASLARQCRFTGHLDPDVYYSVAQHAVLCARTFYGEPDFRLARLALHHEDDEVATGDVSGPLKLLIGTVLKPIATAVKHAAWARFGIESTPRAEQLVKEVDGRMLRTEKRDLMPASTADREEWGHLHDVKPYGLMIQPVEWREARAMWLAHWMQLMRDRSCLGGYADCAQAVTPSPQEYRPFSYVDSWGKTRLVYLHESLDDPYLHRAIDNLPNEGLFL